MNDEQKQRALALFPHLLNLDTQQRAEAKTKAREAIRAEYTKPNRDDYKNVSISEYPAWLTWGMLAMMGVLLVATATPSFFRMFYAGRTYFLHGINDTIQATFVGFAMFIMAETMLIGASIAREVLFKDDKIKRNILLAIMAMAFALAIVGNWTVAQPYDAFGLLETVTPSFATIAITMVLEGLVLSNLRERIANERAYQTALKEYQANTDTPESNENWVQVYSSYLKTAIESVNRTGAGAKDRTRILGELTLTDWSYLIQREFMLDKRRFDAVELADGDIRGNIRVSSARAVLGDNSTVIPQISSQNFQPIPIGTGNHEMNRPTPKTQRVIDYFKANPDRISETCTSLESEIGISKSTINNVQNAIRKGEIEL